MIRRILPIILLLAMVIAPLDTSAQDGEPGEPEETSQVANLQLDETSEVLEPEAPLAWSRVANNGFGASSNTTVWSLAEFKGYIYAGTRNTDGAQVWRSSNGATWTQVQSTGMGDTDNTAITSMAASMDYLYLGTENVEDGAEVWRTDGTAWTQINTDGFGTKQNAKAWSMAVDTTSMSPSYLFVGTQNTVSGAHLYRYYLSGWSPVFTNGFDGSNTTLISGMDSDNLGRVVAGTWNGVTGGRVLTGAMDNAWQAVSSNGFGDAQNVAVRSVLVTCKYIYAGTFNPTTGAQIWRMEWNTPGWTRVADNGFNDSHNTGISSMFEYGEYIYAGTENMVTGAEVWRSRDGVAWEQVNLDGFGYANNHEAVSMAGFGPYLFVGTRNFATGGEVWRVNLLGTERSFLINSQANYLYAGGAAYNSHNRQYLTVWSTYDSSGTGNSIQGQRLFWDGRLVGAPITLSSGGNAQRGELAVAHDSDLNRYLVVWSQRFDLDDSVRGRIFSSTGSPVTGEFDIATGERYFFHIRVSYVPDADRYLVSYHFYDHSTSTAYHGLNVQPVTGNGALDGAPLLVKTGNVYLHNALAYNPARDETLIVWSEQDFVYGRRIVYHNGFSLLNDPFIIGEKMTGYHFYGANVGVIDSPAGSGQYLVTWTSADSTYNERDIWSRRVSGEGVPLGSQTRASTTTLCGSPESKVIGLPVSQRYQVVMRRQSDSCGVLLSRQVNSAGSPIGSQAWIAGADVYDYALARGPGDTYLVFYDDVPAGEIYTQVRGRVFGLRHIYLPMIRR